MDPPVAPRPLRYAGVLACAAVVLYGSVTAPGDGDPLRLFGIGIAVYLHLVAYAGLTGAVGYALLAADRRALLLAAGVATLYGLGVELLQGTLPYRSMAATDVLLNAAGAAAGAALWRLVAPVFGARVTATGR